MPDYLLLTIISAMALGATFGLVVGALKGYCAGWRKRGEYDSKILADKADTDWPLRDAGVEYFVFTRKK